MKTIYRLLIAALFIGTATLAKADDFTINLSPGFSGNVTAMTDYVARGISQTSAHPNFNSNPALNTQVGYQFQNGLFGQIATVNTLQGNGHVEGDLTVGYATKLNDNWSYQTSIVYTTYPGSTNYGNLSTVEFQNIVNYIQDWGKLVAAFGVQPQGQNHGGFYTYTSVGADFNLPYDFVGGFRVGYNTYSNHAAHPNYVDWTVTLSHPITSWATASVQYTGSTNYSPNLDPGNGQRIVGLVSISF